MEQSGLDHGPISVHEKMRDLGMTPVPSTAALARIFRDANVARAEPRKKPRASYRRFVYPAPNACWQLDATDYVLTGGRTCVIFQLIDDHSRYAVASHVASGETAEGAIAVVKNSIAQVAAFLLPVLVLVSLLTATTLTFAFAPVYTGALLGTAVILWQITGDGEATPFEGAALIAAFVILATVAAFE